MIKSVTVLTLRTQYDNQTFTGLGPRKEIAKNICAEQVLSQSWDKEEGERNWFAFSVHVPAVR